MSRSTKCTLSKLGVVGNFIHVNIGVKRLVLYFRVSLVSRRISSTSTTTPLDLNLGPSRRRVEVLLRRRRYTDRVTDRGLILENSTRRQS